LGCYLCTTLITVVRIILFALRKIAPACGYCSYYIIFIILRQARRRKMLPWSVSRWLINIYFARKLGHSEKRVAHRPNHAIFTACPRKNTAPGAVRLMNGSFRTTPPHSCAIGLVSRVAIKKKNNNNHKKELPLPDQKSVGK